MRLFIAWVVSAFVGLAVCFLALVTVGAISEVYRWGRIPDPNALLFPLGLFPAGVYACAFGVLLVLQLAYGSLVYFVLRRLGLLNLPLVLLAYLVPIAG